MKARTIQAIVVVAAALIIAVGATALALGTTGSTAILTEDQAIEIAKDEARGAVTGVESETEGGRLIYGVAFDSGTEVEVAADNGEILEVENEDTVDGTEVDDADGVEEEADGVEEVGEHVD